MRVSSLAQQQALIQAFQAGQLRVATAQEQVATGKVHSDFSGLASETLTLLGSKEVSARVTTYRETITTVRTNLVSNDVHYDAILAAARSVRDDLLQFVALDQAVGFDDTLETNFDAIAASLNSRLAGRFLFAGSQINTPPLNIDSVAQLEAAAAVGDVFDNDDVHYRAIVAENLEVEYGAVASDIAAPIFAVIRDLAIQDTATPFEGELDAAQRTFLEGQLAQLDSAIDNLEAIQAQNGLRINQVDAIDIQHAEFEVTIQTFVSDIEDVDLAEAISRLNGDQTALEAAYRVAATLNQVSLLNFI